MSYLPQLNTINKTQSVQQEFRGLNHNNFLDDTEFYDMKNMSVDNYPYASPRKKRGIYKAVDDDGNIITDEKGCDVTFGTYKYKQGATAVCNGIATKQGFCFVEGNRFYYRSNEDSVYHDIGQVTDGEKQFVSLGAYILIFPDKKFFYSIMFNHYDDAEWLEAHGLKQSAYFGDLEASSMFGTVKMNMCNVYGEDYEFDYTQSNMPDTDNGDVVENGTMWLDVSSSPAKMMQYSDTYSGWLEITSNYIKITVDEDLTEKYKDYDGITFDGFPESLKAFNSATVTYMIGKTEDGLHSFFVVPGIISPESVEKENIVFNSADNSITYTADSESGLKQITVNRKIPDMDFVCELDNRLWGCSNDNHEIYSSKLGDPFNFNCFMNLSTDSYVATIGSDGDFTGCISHLGYVLFFKEDCIHKIYGTKPTNYQITNVPMRGVQRGCERSLCIVNETLFYKAKGGVMMYQGSLPEGISDELGTDIYSNAVAGSCGNKYYISMKDSLGVWWLFVYDTVSGLWHKEDKTQFKYVLSTLTELYYIDGEDMSLKTVNGTGDKFSVYRLTKSDVSGAEYEQLNYVVIPEDEIEWSCESGNLYAGSIDHKYFSKFRILLYIKKDTKISVYLQYDNEKEWKRICTKTYKYSGSERDLHNLPVMPRRCQRLRIKIAGKGDCLIQAIAKNVEQGSEL